MKHTVKMISLFIVLALTISAGMIFAQAKDTDIAPVKADDITVIDNSGDVITFGGRNIAGSSVPASTGSLPSYYSSRDLGYTTPVKNQKYTNLCWAYSSMSGLELLMNKNGDYTQPYSPLHLAYWAREDSDGTGWIFRSDSTWLTAGGFDDMSIGYLTCSSGTKDEYLENLSNVNLYSNLTESLQLEYLALEQAFDETSDPRVTADSVIYVDTSDTDNVKNAIYEYGYVTASFSVDFDYFTENYISYYLDEIESLSGHGIIIVGWDDSYSKSNFVSDCQPSSDGAWICQNSWGSSTGDGGFFYISYEDAGLFSEYFPDSYAVTSYHSVGKYESVYALAQSGAINSYEPSSSDSTNRNVTYMNRYTFDSDELVEHIQFTSPSAGAEYTVYYIPVSSDGSPKNKSNWTELSSGTVPYSGLINSDIDDYEVDEGEGFIGVRMKNGSADSKEMGIIFDWADYTIPNYSDDLSYILINDSSEYKLTDIFTQNNIIFSINAKTTKNYRYGDSNSDKTVTVSDALLIQRVRAMYEESSFNEDFADANNDGDISIQDVRAIQAYLANYDIDYVGELIR